MLREADAQYPPGEIHEGWDKNTNVVAFMLEVRHVPAKSGIIEAISERRLPGKQARVNVGLVGKPIDLRSDGPCSRLA